jgi:tRNA(adenine34) deaminase
MNKQSSDVFWMHQALEKAREAQALGEVPVGAVVVLDGELIGAGSNRPISDQDPTSHAEIVALREAARRLGNYRLSNAVLYSTIEPCAMCAGAMIHARVARLVFGAREPRGGAVVSQTKLFDLAGLNHRIEVTEGVCAEEASTLIQTFFHAKR